MVNNVRGQSKVNFNNEIILVEVNNRFRHGSECSRRIVGNSFRLESKVMKKNLHIGECERARERYQRQTRFVKEDKESYMIIQTFLHKDCNRIFRTRDALTIHQIWLHRDPTNEHLFVCPNSSDDFKQKRRMKTFF